MFYVIYYFGLRCFVLPTANEVVLLVVLNCVSFSLLAVRAFVGDFKVQVSNWEIMVDVFG